MSIAISVQYFDSLEYLQLAAIANANSVAVTFTFDSKQSTPILLTHEQGSITHVAAAARYISQAGSAACSVEQHSSSAAQSAHLDQVLDTIEGQLHPLVSVSLSGGAAADLPSVLAFLEGALKATGTGQFSFGKQKGSLSIADIEAAILLSALPAASLQPYPLLSSLLASASASLTISTTLAANSIKTAKDIVKSSVHAALPLPRSGPAPAFPASSSKAETKSSEPRDIAWRPLIPDGHTPFTWFKPLPGQISHPFLQPSAAPAPAASAAPAAQADGAPATSGKKTKKKEERDAKLAAKKEAAAAKAQTKAAETDASAGEKKLKGRVKPKTNTQVVTEVIKKKVPHPIQDPSPKTRNILITSALPYVNNVPHLGNLIGCVLSADVYSRFCRLRGYNCLYVCGTDEYGTATETKALDEKVTPKQLCDKYHAIHRAIYEWFDIDFDHFGRTTTPQQTDIAQGIFWGCQKNKFVSEGQMDQLWCHTCDRFLSDRFVSGTCPKCGFGDARGDQCDGCGNLLNADELISAKCNRCKNPPEIRVSKHLFLDLDNDELQGRLNRFIATSSEKGKWTSNSVAITKAWINSGLKPRCITRDLKWGTPVPLDGYKDKVFYVWFDAPIGYISITANFTKNWEKWWKNPKDVELVQFMGKDNIPFHTVIFPSSLLATGEPWTLLHHVSTTEFLNYEQAKFSKSRGTGVFGDDAMRTGILPEVWRYYLMSTRPETNDSTFTWAEFQSRTNGELLANLGNFINRCLSFCKASFNGRVPALGALTAAEKTLIDSVQAELDGYIDDLENVRLRDALRRVMTISSIGNAYQQDQKPWDLLKNGQSERCGTVVAVALNLVRLLGILAEPYMPATTLRVCEQLNIPREGLTLAGKPKFELVLPAGHEIGTPIPLFARIENEQVEELRKRFAGPEEKKEGPDFTLRLVSGVVTSVEDHPSAEHLYVLKVDTGVNGGGERSIVSGLKGHYSKDELKNKTVIVIANIKSANFKGVPSQGMVLTGQEGNTTGLLTVQGGKSLPPGTKIVPKGSNVVPSKNFNPKTEMKQQHLSVRKDGVVQFGSETHPLVVEGQDNFIVAEKVSPSAVIA